MSENRNLLLQLEQQTTDNLSKLQNAKISDLHDFIKGITKKMLTYKKDIKQCILFLETMDLYRLKMHNTYREDTQDITLLIQTVDKLKTGYLFIQDFINRFSSLFKVKKTLLYQSDMKLLIIKAVSIIKQKFPSQSIQQDIQNTVKKECYPDEIVIAIGNLITNACESGINPDLFITIKAYLSADKYIIEIEDNGSGISLFNKRFIFSPFHTTKKDHEGLGLYLARTYLERNSGRIELIKKTGPGCLFKITFYLDSPGK